MQNLRIRKALFLPVFLLFLTYPVIAQNEKARLVHHKACVIDTHTDTPMQLLDGCDLAVRHEAPDYRVDFPRLREGDVDAIFFGVFTGQKKRTPENYDEAYKMANRMIDSTKKAVSLNRGTVEMAYSVKDIAHISGQDKTAILLGMENGFPLEKNISRVEEFFKKGIRYITLCHTTGNDICSSSTDEGTDNGLSDFGVQVVKEMNRLGMVIDVSHISDKAFYDVLAITKAPVIASHSSVRALCNHPRNMSDDMIKALAKNGGVIQICILGDYIVPGDTTSINHLKHQELRKKFHNWQFIDDKERAKAWREYDSIDRAFPPVLPYITDAVNHIDHVVKLVGTDYVGIGSDFDGGGGLADCRDVADFPKITEELLRRGYSQKDIDKIWGGNFLRVFKEVEKAKAGN
ncbi:MAG TPA: dipeptidase [Bacteroidales bacterium]|nr:dipeptidase [Bacteroidales bacterium]